MVRGGKYPGKDAGRQNMPASAPNLTFQRVHTKWHAPLGMDTLDPQINIISCLRTYLPDPAKKPARRSARSLLAGLLADLLAGIFRNMPASKK